MPDGHRIFVDTELLYTDEEKAIALRLYADGHPDGPVWEQADRAVRGRYLELGGREWLAEFARAGRTEGKATMRQRIARRLRFLADRIDYAGAPKAMGWTFTFEEREGIRFRDDGRGCRLWYLGDTDYERAHTEADTEHFRVDWVNVTASRVGGHAR